MNDAIVVAMLRALPTVMLGALVLELPDEDIAPIGRSVLARLAVEQGAERRAAGAKPRPTAGLRTEIASKPTKGKPGPKPGPKLGSNGSNPELVFRAIAGADDALSKTDIIKLTGLSENQVGHGLAVLRREKRAFSAGHSRGARWAITQEAADEAVNG